MFAIDKRKNIFALLLFTCLILITLLYVILSIKSYEKVSIGTVNNNINRKSIIGAVTSNNNYVAYFPGTGKISANLKSLEPESTNLIIEEIVKTRSK